MRTLIISLVLLTPPAAVPPQQISAQEELGEELPERFSEFGTPNEGL